MKPDWLLRASLLFLFSLLFAGIASADPRLWDTTGVTVRTASHLSWTKALATRADGYSLVAWTQMESGSLMVRAQLLNPQGVAVWPEGGVPVMTRVGGQRNPEVCATQNGWIVALQACPGTDGINPADAAYPRAQKLSDAGAPQWGATGVALDDDLSRLLPQSDWIVMASDGAGGALIAWQSNGPGDVRSVFAQRYAADGQPQWNGARVIENASYPAAELNVELTGCSDEQGGLLLAWRHFDTEAYELRQRMVRVMGNGNRPWGDMGMELPGVPYESWLSAICPDGAGGAYYTLNFHPNDHTATILGFRIDGNGSQLWSGAGVQIDTCADIDHDPNLTASVNAGLTDGCVCLWNYTTPSGMLARLKAQKLSPDGETLWGPAGVPVAGDNPFNYYFHTPEVISDSSGGIVAVWRFSDLQLGPGSSIYGNRLSPTGDPCWPEATGLRLDARDNSQEDPVLTLCGAGTLRLVTHSTANRATLVRALSLDLATGDSIPGSTSTLVRGIEYNADVPAIVPIGTDRMGVLWSDGRARQVEGYRVYQQFLFADGSQQLAVNGTCLTPNEVDTTYEGSEEYCVASDGSGGYFAVWNGAARDQSSAIYFTHVNASGQFVGVPGLAVWDPPEGGGQANAQCVPDSAGGCYIAWQQYLDGGAIDPCLMRFTAEGGPLWTQPLVLQTGGREDPIRSVVSAPGGGCYVLWNHTNVNGSHVGTRVARVNRDGSTVFNSYVPGTGNETFGQSLAPDGSGGLYVLWIQGATVVSRLVTVQRLNAAGEAQWTPGGVRVSMREGLQMATRLNPDNQGVMVAWLDYENHEIRAQRFTENGARLWGEWGVPLSENRAILGVPEAVDDGQGGLFAVWAQAYADTQLYSTVVMGAHLDAAGNPYDSYWVPRRGGQISSYPVYVSSCTVEKDHAGDAVVVWSSWRYPTDSYPSCIHAQRIALREVTALPRAESVPARFALEQNYPNPFNAETSIAFELPRGGKASLKLFDLLGRETLTLADQSLDAGRHEIRFDARDLPSGVYVFRLECGGVRLSRKLLLLK